jgi:galactonate dehydratase
MARRLLPLLEPLQLMWVEEPVLPDYPEALSELANLTTVPLATGERLFSRAEYKPVLGHGVDIIQPDVAQAGGISEMRRIAAMAEAYDVSVAPHCAIGAIALAASLQISVATPNVLIQEQGLDVFGPVALDYLVDGSVVTHVDGSIPRPTGPGLGIEVDEAAVERAAEIGFPSGPHGLRHRDGSFAEW